MNIRRILRHLCTPERAVHRILPEPAMAAIGEAVREGEARHRGEIRVVVEAALNPAELLRNETPRERASEVFATERVWDTEENNGVLIYLLLADHDVEIVADRGIRAPVGDAGWEPICRRMEAAFREGRFEAGLIDGVRAVAELLAREFPATGANANELPDRPAVLR